MKQEKNKTNEKASVKYLLLLIGIFLILWRVPLLFLELGVLWSMLLPVIAFLIANFIVQLIRKRKGKKCKN